MKATISYGGKVGPAVGLGSGCLGAFLLQLHEGPAIA